MHLSHKSLRTICLTAMVALFMVNGLPATAHAASSEWATTMGGRMRVVALPPDANGAVEAVLEIEPDEGWHTYWRAPGSGGIPPQITVAAGGNIALKKVDFPTPEIIAYDNLRDYGYNGPVALPLTFEQTTVGVPSKLDLTAFVGVCAEICVPFQADFQLDLNGEDAPAPSELALVKAARAMLPEMPGDDFDVEEFQLSDEGKAAEVTIRLPDNASRDNVSIFAYDGTQALNPASVQETEEGRLAVKLEPFFIGADETLDGHTIGILVNTGIRAMETKFKLP